ncbi:hypothetical protein [Bradyrhizobium cenepequi]
MSIVDDFEAIGARLRGLSERPTAAEPECSACDGAGWEMYSLGYMDPHFRQCEKCLNLKGLPSP